jgi:phage shock protein PspC (stress-responsive transcriptional regulator)
MQVNRRLYRCRHDRRLAGVASGVAEYFDLDPSLVRVLWFVSIFFGGVTLLLYVGMAIIVPLEPVSADAGAAPEAADASGLPEGHRHATRDHGRWTTFVGLALIFFGSLALIDRYLPALDVKHLLVPAVAIGLGAFLVASAVRRDPMES